jgi:hypothetical protein
MQIREIEIESAHVRLYPLPAVLDLALRESGLQTETIHLLNLESQSIL